MSDEQTRQADWILPPVISNIHVATTSTVVAAIDITLLAARETYVSFQADGAKVYIMFASTSGLADDLLVAGTGTPASPGATTCIMIPDGSTAEFKLSAVGGSQNFLGHITASGTGYLRYWVSGPPRFSTGYTR